MVRRIAPVHRQVALALTLATASAATAAGGGQGERLSAACAACHRLDGGGKGVRIVGLEPAKLTAMMQAFKADGRGNHIMHAVSLTLSDAEVVALAQHLAGLGRNGGHP